MIEVSNVTKTYGEVAALRDVSLRVGKGEIVGLLGPNGAGKTTLIRSLTGYFEPSAGHITIDGKDVVQDPLGVQRVVGYLPEQAPLYPEMLVQEYLDMVADLRDLPQGEPRLRALAEAVWATGLAEHLTRPIGALSKGFRQRVGLAQAILHKPKVLIFDEPTSGLDPSQVVHVRALIRDLGREATVLFSTHILTEVEQVCERVIVLLGGQVRLDARLADLQTTPMLRFAISEGSLSAGEVHDKVRRLERVRAARRIESRPGTLAFETEATGDADLARQVFRLAKDNGWELCELTPVRRDLETVFRELVRDYEAGIDAAPANVRSLEEPTL